MSAWWWLIYNVVFFLGGIEEQSLHVILMKALWQSSEVKYRCRNISEIALCRDIGSGVCISYARVTKHQAGFILKRM